MLIEPGNYPFCENIRYLRERYALSRMAMAKLLHISVLKIRDWEQEIGPAVLHYSTCKRICAVFEITPQQLFQERLEGENTTPQSKNRFLTAPLTRETYLVNSEE